MKRLIALLIMRDTDHFRLWARALNIACKEWDGQSRLSPYARVELWAIGILMIH